MARRQFEGDDVVLAFIAQGERAALFDGDLRTRDGIVEKAADDHLVFPVWDLPEPGELLGWEIRPMSDEEWERRERERELATDLDGDGSGQALVALFAALAVLLVGLLGWGYLELVWWLEAR